MAISEYPSKVSLPRKNPGVATVLEFLILKFPNIDAYIWRQRISDGKVHLRDGSLITTQTLFHPQLLVHYYREVETEPNVPFKEKILFQDEHILIAYKPHYLALTPSGLIVNECLQNRLRRSTGNKNLQALHRVDRVTAGLVMFSVNPNSRHLYHRLFAERQIHKTYQAIANIDKGENLVGQEWEIKNRIVRTEKRFRMCVVEGEANSYSKIRCVQQTTENALFELHPVTGKTHQLRIHMQALGWPIRYDKLYPQLLTKSVDDFSTPLQLLAKGLKFNDPVTMQPRCFNCESNLSLN